MIMFRLSLPRDQLLYHQRNEIFLADTGHDPGHQSYTDDEDDEEGFNDAEEITDDMLDNDQNSANNVEDIKIEPDINIALLQQYM